MNYPNVSIVVPLYNGEKTIKECLESIKKQRYLGKTEITVIDDKSSDNGYEKIKEFKNLKIIKHKLNKGSAFTFNEGIKISKYNLVCIVHPDCIIQEKNWLQNIVKEKIKNKNIALVGTKMVIPEAMLKKADFWNIVMITNRLKKTFKYGTVKNTIFEKEDNRIALYDKKLITKVGFYDEKTFRIAGDDHDLSLRVMKKGYIIKETNYEILHLHAFKSSTMVYWLFKKTAPTGEAAGVLFRKHRFLMNKYWNPITSTGLYLSLLVPYLNRFSFALIILISLYYTYNVSKYVKNIKLLLLPLFKITKDLITILAFWKGFITKKQSL
jgi:GT2 family glycosyltransferase